MSHLVEIEFKSRRREERGMCITCSGWLAGCQVAFLLPCYLSMICVLPRGSYLQVWERGPCDDLCRPS